METLSERIKTVTWKFRDVEESYPEIKEFSNTCINKTADFYKHFRFLFDHETTEKFCVFWLNMDGRVIGLEVISQGILNSTAAHPREIFRGAIVASCASIILAHNHPSGNPTPSATDIDLTKNLVEIGKIIGIPVLDHIVFGKDSYESVMKVIQLQEGRAT